MLDDLKSYIKLLLKKGSLLTPLLMLCLHLEAQQTFNVKFDLGSNTIAGGLFETKDGFLIVGTGGDTLGPTHSDLFILKTNNIGETMSLFHWGESERECYARTKAQGMFSDSTYLSASLVVQPGPNECMLFWFNNVGDTIKTMHFPSPVVDEHEFIETRHLVVDPVEDCFYLSLGIYRTDTQNDYLVQKRNKEGELLWEFYSTGEYDEGSLCMLVDQSGLLISESGFNGDEYYGLLRKVSKNGSLIWNCSVDYPTLGGRAYDLIKEETEIVYGTFGTEEGSIASNPALCKIDTMCNIIWNTILFEYQLGSTQRINNIASTCDGGYIGAARYHVPTVQGDTLDASENYAAWLIRYDHDGSILWDKKYTFVNSPKFNHEIYDIISTIDGGIALCGEASDLWLENPNFDAPAQQAWIMKLDACGCLVPGCDEFCSPPNCDLEIPIDLPAPDHFIFGPNPITQSLNIYFDGSDLILENLSFELYDITGRLVDRFIPSTSDTTYIWDLENLSAGEYILSLEQGKKRLQSEKILKL
jgi:hypothetical protein